MILNWLHLSGELERLYRLGVQRRPLRVDHQLHVVDHQLLQILVDALNLSNLEKRAELLKAKLDEAKNTIRALRKVNRGLLADYNAFLHSSFLPGGVSEHKHAERNRVGLSPDKGNIDPLLQELKPVLELLHGNFEALKSPIESSLDLFVDQLGACAALEASESA
ncbi:hypothetical protein L596_024977 [Steinernema carpocapsae]|uniref:Uncharacterized protein n=1 Tax=Steinernema carpocapsae TaxID=34508 RepID=A0A4U5M6F6_STECR|nr:hypothetical protein L596_024977 [Steinernema carpocapsae]